MLRRQGEDDRYTVQLRVKNSTVQEGFPALAADKVLDHYLGHWPSDHATVLATLRLA